MESSVKYFEYLFMSLETSYYSVEIDTIKVKRCDFYL
jgi:hypothetical protein